MRYVVRRTKKAILKLQLSEIPNASHINSSLLDGETLPTELMNDYARKILLLFVPYRCYADLAHHGSYVGYLQYLHGCQKYVTKNETDFLQNIQDVKVNCGRIPRAQDDLQSCTHIYVPPKDGPGLVTREDEVHQEDTLLTEGLTEQILQLIEESESTLETNAAGIPRKIDFSELRDRGSLESGYSQIAGLNQISTGTDGDSTFLETLPVCPPTTDITITNTSHVVKPSKCQIRLVLQQTTTRNRIKLGSVENVRNVILPNGSTTSIVDWSKKAFHGDVCQMRAFQTITSAFVLTFYDDAQKEMPIHEGRNDSFLRNHKRLRRLAYGKYAHKSTCKNLIMLLHGAGGSGKSTVIDLVMEYAREYCNALDHYFSSRTIIVTAMSGVAATLIMGETAHSALLLNQKKKIEPNQIEVYSDTRLVIVDEISFAKKEDFQKIDNNLRKLKENASDPYGGVHMIFSGDLRQLEPVMAPPIYDVQCPQFTDSVNCYIELTGMWRFKNDPEWGFLLKGFRDGTPSESDIDLLNTRCVTESQEDLPLGIKYVTYKNEDRDAINTALFEEHILKHAKPCHSGLRHPTAVLVLADRLKLTDSNKILSAKTSSVFWQRCGEDSVHVSRGRMDPVLKLFPGCQLMLVSNEDVPNGLANGTQATAVKVMLKPGEISQYVTIVIRGFQVEVQAVLASQVHHILVKHNNKRIVPEYFEAKPKDFSFTAKLPLPDDLCMGISISRGVPMKGLQLAFVANGATTGHKLQGSTVDHLFVHDWNYTTNWPYVVLSRVTTMAGLYFRTKLQKRFQSFKIPDNYKSFMRAMTQHAAECYSDQQLASLFGWDEGNDFHRT